MMEAPQSMGPEMASMPRTEPNPAVRPEERTRGLRLLSLDGGGVRGVSELYILEKLMERLKGDESVDWGGQEMLPCNTFDMICGTSTGGLIAIMLGRLRMSIEDCQNAYGEFAKSVFDDPKRGFGFQEGRYKATNLKKAIVDIVNRYDKENDDMLDPRQNVCKVFLCAMPGAEMRRPRLFRTYEVDGINENCKIWEAARASTAAPTYFKAAEITIRPGVVERFVDGGMGCNNPVLQLCEEATRIYKGRKIDCIVSIGTGTTPSKGLSRPSPFQNRIPLYVVPTLRDIANECEKNHEIMFRDFKNRPNTYFRFNVPDIGAVDLAAWRSIPILRGKTIAYLDSPEIDSSINSAVKSLSASMSQIISDVLSDLPGGERSFLPTRPHQGLESEGQPEDIGALAENDNIWRQEASLRPNVIDGPRSGVTLKNDVEQQEAFLQGLKVNLHSVQNVKHKKETRFQGTCEWFETREIFIDWKDNPGDQVLLIFAPPGQGKSVLAKYLAEKLTGNQDSRDQTINVNYFCQNSADQSAALTMVRYFLYQILSTKRYLFKYVFQQHTMLNDRGSDLSFGVLWTIFVTILRQRQKGDACFIIDGVDECDSESQKLLLDAIEKDFTRRDGDPLPSTSRVRFLITSRPTALATKLGRLSSLYEIQNSDVNPDISKVIEFQVQRMTKARILPEHLQSIVRSILNVGAEGMFLWVTLNLERLNQVQQGRSVVSMQEELSRIPKNVQAIYAAAIEQIKEDRFKHQFAERILSVLLYSPGSLEIKAFAIACTDWPESCTLHSELEMRVDFNFEYSSKEVCGSLIRFADDSIQFCHPTVSQYLVSDDSSLIFDHKECHLHLARTCMRYLLLQDLEIPLPRDGIIILEEGRFPFLIYALQNWARHLKEADTFILRYPQLLYQFFHAENGRFKNILRTGQYFQVAFPKDHGDLDTIIIHALVCFNLGHILQKVHFVSSTLEKDSEHDESLSSVLELRTDVDSRDSTQCTPLLVAANLGSVEAIKVLLKHGANPEAVNEQNETALHIVSRGTGDDYVAAAKILIPLSETLEKKDVRGNTPLLLAKIKEIAQLLLENGARVDCEGADAEIRPLSVAAGDGNEDLVRLLLSHEANVNYKSERYWTALHDAATQSNSNIVAVLLQHKAEVCSEKESGWNALHIAASSGFSKSVELLLDYKVDVNCPTLDSQTPLSIGARNGHEDVVKALLKAGANIMTADNDGDTPLHAAATSGSVIIATMLIQAGADINKESTLNGTPLTIACGAGHFSMVKFLVENAADKDYTSDSKIPMLQLAIYSGHLEIAEYLIGCNINLESTFQSNYTPLYVAAWKDHISIAKLLLDKGANPRCSGESGLTALHQFARNGHDELVNRLLDLGLSTDVKDVNKWTPLHQAVQNGRLIVAKTLVKHGASTAARTYREVTPLLQASGEGYLEIVEWLVNEEKSDPNECSNTGWSSLHAAVRSGHLDIVNTLLSLGASPKARTFEGVRPLYEAARLGNLRIVNRLLELDPNEGAHSAERFTPLSIAAREGHLQVVNALLDAGADINCASQFANLAFHNALEKGHVEVVKRLLRSMSDPLKESYVGNPSIVSAALGSNVKIVDIILELGADINQRTSRGHTALHAAAEQGCVAVIDHLLQCGAEIDMFTRFGTTPLMLASLHGHVDAAKRLLKAGSDPNKLSSHDTTSLHWAAWRYRDSVMKVLLEYKADPFVSDCYGRSAFYWAQMYAPAAELMSTLNSSYHSLEDDEREKHIRSSLATTSKFMLEHGSAELAYADVLAHASLFLGKLEDAFVGFEYNISPIPEELRGTVGIGDVNHNLRCFGCSSDSITGTRFVCKTCPEADICTACMDKYKEGTTIRGCSSHEFLEVPRPSWFDLAPGTVNEQGETLYQWIQRIYDTYKDAILEDTESIPAAAPSPIVSGVVEREQSLESG